MPSSRADSMTSQITIAGGFYRERCRFPQSDEFWGSGGRAAAAIAELVAGINFVTAADAQSEPILASIAQAIGFKYSAMRISETISFSYDHGLSTPIIWPPLHTLNAPRCGRQVTAYSNIWDVGGRCRGRSEHSNL